MNNLLIWGAGDQGTVMGAGGVVIRDISHRAAAVSVLAWVIKEV